MGLLVLADIVALAVLWPQARDLPPLGPEREAYVDATVLGLDRYQSEPNEFTGPTGEAAIVRLRLDSGEDAGEEIEVDTPLDAYPDFDIGDRVKVIDGQGGEGGGYAIVDFERRDALAWLLGLFVVAVLAVSRWQGARSLVALASSLAVVTTFVVPGIIAGLSPFVVSLVGGGTVMLASFLFTHGLGEKTLVAVLGTAVALGATIGLGALFIEFGEITGFSSEEANFVRFSVEGLDLKGLVLAGLLIAALGVLDDVTISQASTVHALHDADPTQTWTHLVRRAMRVGRDHIASTVNTLFLAYVGASLPLIIVFTIGGQPTQDILTSEVVATEVVKLIVGSLGIIAAVPLTTVLAARTVAGRRSRRAVS